MPVDRTWIQAASTAERCLNGCGASLPANRAGACDACIEAAKARLWLISPDDIGHTFRRCEKIADMAAEDDGESFYIAGNHAPGGVSLAFADDPAALEEEPLSVPFAKGGTLSIARETVFGAAPGETIIPLAAGGQFSVRAKAESASSITIKRPEPVTVRITYKPAISPEAQRATVDNALRKFWEPSSWIGRLLGRPLSTPPARPAELTPAQQRAAEAGAALARANARSDERQSAPLAAAYLNGHGALL